MELRPIGEVRVTVPCPECGHEGSGNYCSRCGARLAAPEGACPECGGEVKEGALYCGQCGHPLRAPGKKPLSAHLPWILAGVALVAFAVALGLFVQDQSAPRGMDDPITGGLPSADAEGGGGMAGTDATGAPSGAAMPSPSELANMSPREAADRLFDRAMREQETGDAERARFFAQMGAQAYERVPPARMDADARFHVGMLQLAMENPEGAAEPAEALLAERPDHLLGLILAIRVADARGEGGRADSLRERLREAVADGALEEGLPGYESHRAFIEAEAGVSPD